MIISPSRNFIFIHLEKCGGTSIESAIQPYLGWDDMIIGSTEFGERYQSLYFERFGRDRVVNEMLWKHSTAKDIHAFLGPDAWEEYNKISIVRNPEQLLTSLYSFSQMTIKYHVGRLNRETWKELLRTNNFPNHYPFTEGYIHSYARAALEGSGINGFVDDVLNSGQCFIEPQFRRIEVNRLTDVGNIFDLSDIHNAWEKIKSITDLPKEVKLDKLNASEPTEEVLSSRSKKMIHKHFAIDYQELPRYTGITW